MVFQVLFRAMDVIGCADGIEALFRLKKCLIHSDSYLDKAR